MTSTRARAPNRVLIALCGMVLGGAACEISSSGDDRKARLAELEKIERLNRLDDRLEREIIRDRQILESRYQGRIEPGVGCDVCADLCEITDLRSMSADEYKQAYRQVSYDLLGEGRHKVRHEAMSGVVQYERYRLLCIARRDPAMRDALLQLYEDANEYATVRYMAAIEAIDEGYGTSGPERALREVGKGQDFIALASRQVVRALEERARSGE